MTISPVWLSQYPHGVPAEISLDRYTSLVDIFEQCCRLYAESPAFTNQGRTLNYTEMDKLSWAFAAYLQQVLHLQKGERLAIMLPNLLQYPVVIFGALRAGLTLVNVNPLYTHRELEHQLNDAGVSAVVLSPLSAHTLMEALKTAPVKHIILTQVGDMLPWLKGTIADIYLKYIKKQILPYALPEAISFKQVLKDGDRLTLKPVTLTHKDLAFLQYTGGTTGVAKGAMLSHGNMVANVLQVAAWFEPFVEKGKEVVITALPLYHIFALTVNCLAFIVKGSRNVLITNPRDMKSFIRDLQTFPFSVITGVNTLFNGLLHAPGFKQLDFSHLKICVAGGMAAQKAVAEQWQKTTGAVLIQGYGLTETSPLACVNPLNAKDFSGSIGIPVSSTEIRIQDDAGQPLVIGEIGEVAIRGPQVMQGYWQRPEETAKVLSPDGWLRTGDIGRMDENGYIYLVDRKKDMILVSGFNVYPNEVEEVLAQHPGVLESAVVGVPDEKSGEAVKAFVVRKDPNLTVEALRDFCHENLTNYKVPRKIEFRASLPKSNVGKILRRELREESKG